jgi:lysophospholipase L1-like esterase
MKLPARPYSKFLSILALCTAALASGTAQVAEPLKSLLKNDVLVFDGDSITDGGRQRTGTDYNHIMGQDYAYILAGRIGYQYPERNLDFINRGVSSSLIGGMASRWQTDVLDLKPNILTILVGINDSMANGDDDASKYEAIYNKIIEDTLAALPNIKIILGEPFILPVGKHKDTYASDLAKVKLRQAALAADSLPEGYGRRLPQSSTGALELGWHSSHLCRPCSARGRVDTCSQPEVALSSIRLRNDIYVAWHELRK